MLCCCLCVCGPRSADRFSAEPRMTFRLPALPKAVALDSLLRLDWRGKARPCVQCWRRRVTPCPFRVLASVCQFTKVQGPSQAHRGGWICGRAKWALAVDRPQPLVQFCVSAPSSNFNHIPRFRTSIFGIHFQQPSPRQRALLNPTPSAPFCSAFPVAPQLIPGAVARFLAPPPLLLNNIAAVVRFTRRTLQPSFTAAPRNCSIPPIVTASH